MKVKGDPITSLKHCISCSPKDWSLYHRDAWLWGIIFGWGDAWDEIAVKHKWEGEEIERLKMLHRKFSCLSDNNKQTKKVSTIKIKGYVDFIKKYKHDNDCEPSSHDVWNACSLFMEEKLAGTQQLESAISLVKYVAMRKFNPDQQFELFNILDRLQKQTPPNTVNTDTSKVPCPKHHLGGKCYGNPWRESCDDKPCMVNQPT